MKPIAKLWRNKLGYDVVAVVDSKFVLADVFYIDTDEWVVRSERDSEVYYGKVRPSSSLLKDKDLAIHAAISTLTAGITVDEWENLSWDENGLWQSSKPYIPFVA